MDDVARGNVLIMEGHRGDPQYIPYENGKGNNEVLFGIAQRSSWGRFKKPQMSLLGAVSCKESSHSGHKLHYGGVQSWAFSRSHACGFTSHVERVGFIGIHCEVGQLGSSPLTVQTVN